ncbi:MBOAT family O-acyltransferase [Pseudomonas sp. NA-150]|uniref:MBOAT family O-acyltransferase n=1 Tax=Pseudomonas sp. NA-150 TaxID=3367525 RepID=UPI0037CAA69A
MLFNSPLFIFAFLPITLLGYYLLINRRRTEPALAWLVLCSFVFYGWWNPVYVWLIAASMIFNFALGQVISHPTKWRKSGLAFGICSNLLLLGYYKYFDFFINTLNVALSEDFNLQHIVLPLAISFFTFTQIAFLVDSYRDEAREYNFLHYCLFVTFFTHLIAGPIVHHKQFLPQFLKRENTLVNFNDIAVGLTIFGVGLFKKIVFADNLAGDVAAVYGHPGVAIAVAPDFLSAWIGTLSYALQLYFDFSGYSDMAIGLSLLFGIRLPVNFNSPYKATNIIEFWRRWHITLSNFLRDYLYISLGGNRKGKVRRYVNLWLTMLLGGAWHGASLNFIIWGALHGFYLVINHGWHALRRTMGLHCVLPIFRAPVRAISVLVTFIATLFAWVFFRAYDWYSAKLILAALVGGSGFDVSKVTQGAVLGITQANTVFAQAETLTGLSWPQRTLVFLMDVQKVNWGVTGTLFLLVVLLIIIWFIPNTQQIFRHYKPAFGCGPDVGEGRWCFGMSWRAGLMVALIFFVALSQLFSALPSQFMYFNF